MVKGCFFRQIKNNVTWFNLRTLLPHSNLTLTLKEKEQIEESVSVRVSFEGKEETEFSVSVSIEGKEETTFPSLLDEAKTITIAFLKLHGYLIPGQVKSGRMI